MVSGVFDLKDAIDKVEDADLREEIYYQLKIHDERLKEKIRSEQESIMDDCSYCTQKENLEEEIDDLQNEIWDKEETIDELHTAIRDFLASDDLNYIRQECKHILLMAHIESGLEVDEEDLQ